MVKILVVEDSKFQRKQIIEILKERDFDIHEAKNGEECLEMLTSVEPDIILTDLLMPKIDGVTLLEKLKEQNRTGPVIVLSADIQVPIKEKCLALGAKDFLNKPVEKQALLSVLEKYL